MSDFELLLACYRSGQISAKQWAAHLENEVFARWLMKRW